jgi:hypothetical protein
MKHSRLFVSAATLCSALPALAHPGHALTDASASHLLASPFHLATLAVMGAVTYAAARLVQRRLPRQALQVAGVALVCGAAVLWGMRA